MDTRSLLEGEEAPFPATNENESSRRGGGRLPIFQRLLSLIRGSDRDLPVDEEAEEYLNSSYDDEEYQIAENMEREVSTGSGAVESYSGEADERMVQFSPKRAETGNGNGTPLRRERSWLGLDRRSSHFELDQQNGFHFDDHYSLRSSIITRRNLVLLNDGGDQYIFEPRRQRRKRMGNNLSASNDFPTLSPRGSQQSLLNNAQGDPLHISVKKAKRYGIGVTGLKILYSYVALVLCGYLVAFSVILLLQFTLGVFLAGITSPERNENMAALASLLGLPIMLQSLANIINLFTGFLRDGWNDFDFLHTMTFVPRAVRDWISLAGIMLIPLSTCAISYFIKSSDPWANTLLAAFWCTLGFYLFYTILVFSLQMMACVQLVKHERNISSIQVLIELISLRMITAFSITKRKQLKTIGEQDALDLNDSLSCYLHYLYVPAEERVYEFDRYGKVPPYSTEDTPNVLYMCCMLNRRMKGRIKYYSLINSGICMLVTTLLLWLLFVGFLFYNDAFSLQATVILGAITFFILFGACIMNTKGLRRALYDAMENRRERFARRNMSERYTNGLVVLHEHAQDDGTPSSEGSRISELEIDFESAQTDNTYRTYIVAQPKLGTALLFSIILISIFVVIPMVALFKLGVDGYAAAFILFSCLSLFHAVFNVRTLIEILGPKAQDRLEKMYVSSKEKSVRARRVYLLLTRLLQPERGVFFLTFFTIAIIFGISLASASLNEGSVTSYHGFDLYGNASHRTHIVPRPSRSERGFQYPSCDLGFTTWTLLDFAFLSDVAYTDPSTTQIQLDNWFGEDLVDFIPESDYPKNIPKRHSKTVFKVFKTQIEEEETDMYIVSVRGTTTALDLLSDAQLWLPAIMMQVIRNFVPLGSFWNGLIPRLIYYMGVLESSPASRSSYDTDVINLVSHLKRDFPDALIAVTGHSLGGGVAIITGAKLQVPAIAFSGPNARLSHMKFNVTLENLDKYPVNIIPERDPFPTTDDKSLITEDIRCRAKVNQGDVVCHEITRTACEIMYTCGSGMRPPMVDCSAKYGYPVPIPL